MAEQVSSLKTGIKYKDTPIGKIPVDWEVVRLEDVSEINMGQSPPSEDCSEEAKGLPFYQGNAEFGSKYPSPQKWCEKPKKMAIQGDILISVRAPVGEINIAPHKCCIGRGLAAITARGINPDYLYHSLFIHRKALQKIAQGSTFEAINSKELSDLSIFSPPFSEQKKVAEILTTVDEAIEKTGQIIEKTKEVKKGLMQRLLTHGIGHKKFKKTEIGEIPEEWEVGTFSKIADVNSKRDLERGTIYPFVEMAALDSESHRVKFSKPRRYEGSGTRFQNGDTLFARITPCTENGKTAYVDFLKEIKFGHGSTEFIVLGPKENVDSKFIYYCAKWEKVRNIAVSKMEGTSGRQRVPVRAFLEDIFIPIMPLSEQKQIAEILSSFDDEIERETSHQDQLEELKKGLMQVLLTGKIRVS